MFKVWFLSMEFYGAWQEVAMRHKNSILVCNFQSDIAHIGDRKSYTCFTGPLQNGGVASCTNGCRAKKKFLCILPDVQTCSWKQCREASMSSAPARTLRSFSRRGRSLQGPSPPQGASSSTAGNQHRHDSPGSPLHLQQPGKGCKALGSVPCRSSAR